MATYFPFLPEQGSRFATGVDTFYFSMVGLTIFFASLIFALILFFSVRYRRRSPREIGADIHGSLPLEIFWSVVPLVIVLGIFAWATELFFTRSNPPANTYDVYVAAKQWMWKVQHPEGISEINELHVPAGRAVKLVMTSQDVIHSFYLPIFRIKQDVIPGRYTSQWFQADKPGKYHLFCAEYCGTNHSHMTGWVHVMEPRDYQHWLSQAGIGTSMVAAGEHLFTSLGCASCHVRDCPPLQGLYGSSVALQDGRTVFAGEAYIRESILAPTAKVVRGYRPIMPTFQGQVSEEGMLQLLAYIKSLAGEAPGKVQK
ncbi:MAG: cytochrome c oxidase subunit II [Bryobacterales bacterium]|nr:cytochrome c oxidase subunit II [Bryobacterales bacterium]